LPLLKFQPSYLETEQVPALLTQLKKERTTYVCGLGEGGRMLYFGSISVFHFSVWQGLRAA